MDECLAAADIVVSRAGAITISEICVKGKASVLIPSPNVVRTHQEQNAREFEKNGAAEVITEAELRPDVLYKTVCGMLEDNEYLAKMSENLIKMAKTDALPKIYELMIKMSEK